MGSRRRRFRPRAARPLARIYVRFEKQRAFEKAFETLAGGSVLFRDVMVDIECAYDASGYFTERRIMARRLAHEKRIRRATLDARRAAERPRTPPKAVMMQRPLFLWRGAVTTINERMADAVMRGGRPHKGESRALLPRVRGERSMCTPLIFYSYRSRSATTWRSRRYEGRSTTRTTRFVYRRRLTPSLSPR